MVYEPKTEVGKKAIADGADPEVIEAQEKEGTLTDAVEDKEKKEPEHVETPDEKKAHEDAAKAAAEGDGGSGKGSDEGDGGADGEGDDDKDRQPNREAKSMPVWKAKELAKQESEKARAEAKAEAETEFKKQLADAAGKTGAGKDDAVDKIAEEFNLTPEVAGALVDRIAAVVEQRSGLGDIRKDIEKSRERDKEAAEEKGFSDEWGSKTTQDAVKTIAGDREITAEVREKVKELAYTTTYAKYRIADIVRLESESLFGKKESRTAERGRGGSGRGHAQKTIDEMSVEDINSMNDDDFLKFSDDLGKSGSRYLRGKKR